MTSAPPAVQSEVAVERNVMNRQLLFAGMLQMALIALPVAAQQGPAGVPGAPDLAASIVSPPPPPAPPSSKLKAPQKQRATNNCTAQEGKSCQAKARPTKRQPVKKKKALPAE